MKKIISVKSDSCFIWENWGGCQAIFFLRFFLLFLLLGLLQKCTGGFDAHMESNPKPITSNSKVKY